jgi:hypothetical protein
MRQTDEESVVEEVTVEWTRDFPLYTNGFGCATRLCAARNRLVRLINTQNEALRVPPRPLQLRYSSSAKNPSSGKNSAPFLV